MKGIIMIHVSTHPAIASLYVHVMSVGLSYQPVSRFIALTVFSRRSVPAFTSFLRFSGLESVISVSSGFKSSSCSTDNQQVRRCVPASGDDIEVKHTWTWLNNRKINLDPEIIVIRAGDIEESRQVYFNHVDTWSGKNIN